MLVGTCKKIEKFRGKAGKDTGGGLWIDEYKPRITCAGCMENAVDEYRDSELIGCAFTVAELGEMLPVRIQGSENDRTHNPGMFFGDLRSARHSSRWHIEYIGCFGMNGDTEAEARAKILIYLLENNLVPKEN